MKAKATEIANAGNIQEALEAAHLNFVPEKHQLMTMSGNEIPDHCGILRNDTKQVLGVMGKDYSPFSPVQGLAIADTLREKFNLKYSKLIGVDGGRRIMVELKGGFRQIGKDQIQEQLHILDSWDGSTKFLIRYGFYRLVCKNGLTIGKIENQISIRHTKNAEARLGEALRIWAKAEIVFPALAAKMEALTQKILDTAMVDKFLNDLSGMEEKESTRKKNQKQDIVHLFQYGKGNEGKTAWDLYNAATEYYDHEQNRSDPEKQLASALFGTGADQKSKAFELASAL